MEMIYDLKYFELNRSKTKFDVPIILSRYNFFIDEK